jgi:hypothetical protein
MKKQLFATVLLSVLLSVLAGCANGSPIQSNTPVPNAQGGTPASNNQINVPGVTIQIYAPSPNPLINTPDAQGHVAGVLLGLWHGIISPVTLVVSFFNKGVQIYEVHNDGSQYNLGFLLGVVILLGIVVLIFSRR